MQSEHPAPAVEVRRFDLGADGEAAAFCRKSSCCRLELFIPFYLSMGWAESALAICPHPSQQPADPDEHRGCVENDRDSEDHQPRHGCPLWEYFRLL
jgi:hypothetical protein